MSDRLGDEAAVGLLDLLDATGRAWRTEAVEASVDRFERRLIGESGQVRLEVSQFRLETQKEFAAVRQEMAAGLAAVRREMATEFAAVRNEMATAFAAVRQEMANNRVELLRWSFMFWIGQLAAITGIMALMLRMVAR